MEILQLPRACSHSQQKPNTLQLITVSGVQSRYDFNPRETCRGRALVRVGWGEGIGKVTLMGARSDANSSNTHTHVDDRFRRDRQMLRPNSSCYVPGFLGWSLTHMHTDTHSFAHSLSHPSVTHQIYGVAILQLVFVCLCGAGDVFTIWRNVQYLVM